MERHQKTFLIAVLITAQVAYAQPTYRFQHFGTKEGLLDNFVGSIAQNSLGYIWLSHISTLSRFDGYSYKEYKFN